MSDEQSRDTKHEAVDKLLDKLSNLREKFIEIETLETQLKQIEMDVRSLSLHDKLTGTYNLRGFLNLTEQQIKLADRIKVGILFLYVYVNRTKDDNQTIVETANILKTNYRSSDIVARVSDNEFIVVLISATQDSSPLVMDRFKRAIDAYNRADDRKGTLSVKFDVIYYDPEEPCSVDKLLDRAGNLKWIK